MSERKIKLQIKDMTKKYDNVVVNVQHGENVIKCFVDRDISEKLSVGQSVGMHIGKHTVFDK